jgi:glyoxylase-like metal-dependent hydrolase (beta-lactamase superfamily II)
MYELVHVKGNSYYIESPAKIGLYLVGNGEVCLFDSGNDRGAGKKIKKLLDASGWTLTAIYHTHSHADHIGGSCFLQKETGCRVYAPGIECDFTRHPVLESAFLYGGYPLAELRHKFLLAEASDALPLTADVLPAGVGIVPLPGHSFDMVGFSTPDGVIYLADALSRRETLDKYGIGFVYDVGAYLSTLEAVQGMTAEVLVPSHADPASPESISELARYNIEKVHEAADRIAELCASPANFETILAGVFDRYGIAMTHEQYALVGSTVRSYLAWMKATGRLTSEIHKNMFLWRCV